LKRSFWRVSHKIVPEKREKTIQKANAPSLSDGGPAILFSFVFQVIHDGQHDFGVHAQPKGNGVRAVGYVNFDIDGAFPSMDFANAQRAQ
jgi:hypothetical protein